MPKKKVDTVEIKQINGTWLTEFIHIPVYYDGYFFSYQMEDVIGFIDDKHLTFRVEGKGANRKAMQVVTGASPEAIRTVFWSAYHDMYSNKTVEKKIIAFTFVFNSFEHSRHTNDNGISFCGRPAVHISYSIMFHVTFPDGRQRILSDPYKGFGHICSPTTNKPVEKFELKWIDWTEERETFFANAVKSMEDMIGRLKQFFDQDQESIALLVDSTKNLLTYNKK